MAAFVHLCLESDARRIKRTGLRVRKGRAGVYAMPVTPDYYVSHQWSRELKRWAPGPQAAIYLRLPGDTPVMYGHFHGPHAVGTADDAIGALMVSAEPFGFETMILRDVPATAILSIKPVRAVTGWRYWPGAKGRKPCGCPACQSRGEPFSRRFREPYEAQF